MDSVVVLSNTFVLSTISRQRIFSDPRTSYRVHLSLGRLTDFSHQDPSVANDYTLVYCPKFLPNLPMSGRLTQRDAYVHTVTSNGSVLSHMHAILPPILMRRVSGRFKTCAPLLSMFEPR